MPSPRTRESLHRAFEAVRFLRERKHGWRVDDLAEALRCSRATAYRTLDFLKEVGVILEQELINGEARYRVDENAPPLQPTPTQVAAIQIARRWLTPLEGTELVRELDALLARARAPSKPPPVSPSTGPALHPLAKVNHHLELAIRDKRVTRILYQKPDETEPGWRHVEPMEFRLSRGDGLYVITHDRGRNDIRTFKVMRIRDVELTEEVFTGRPYSPGKLFADSVGVWSGDPVTLTIRIIPEAAALVREYRLVESQEEERQPDGSVIIRATVAGMIEPMHWVRSWGHKAVALAPEAFVQLVRDELRAALEAYGPPA